MATPAYGGEKIVLVEYARPSKGHPWMWGTLGVGVLAGLAYFFLRGREGWGGRESGAGLGMPAPSVIPRDLTRLTFVMAGPTADDPSRPPSFHGPDGKMFSIDDMIMRIKAGGRSDVTFVAAGNVRQGSIDVARGRVKDAGIQIWESVSAKSVGHSMERGCYR